MDRVVNYEPTRTKQRGTKDDKFKFLFRQKQMLHPNTYRWIGCTGMSQKQKWNGCEIRKHKYQTGKYTTGDESIFFYVHIHITVVNMTKILLVMNFHLEK